MKVSLIATMALAVGTTAIAAPASVDAGEKQARIVFPRQAIDNWTAPDENTLYIQANRKWYRADMFAPCFDLRYTNAIGFETGPTDDFDRFSRIAVEGRTCQLKSLVQVAGPPPKAKKHKA